MDKEFLVKQIYIALSKNNYDINYGDRTLVNIPTRELSNDVVEALAVAYQLGADEYKESITPKVVDLTINGYTPPRYLPPYPTKWLEKIK